MTCTWAGTMNDCRGAGPPLGRRVAETDGWASTDLYYSGSWQVLEERRGVTTPLGNSARSNGYAAAQYVFSPVYVDAYVLRDRDSDSDGSHTLDERLYALQDANYNVTAIANGSGSVQERFVYDAYGLVIVLDAGWSAGSDTRGWKVHHQGLRLDGSAGWYDNRNRVYSSTMMRFGQQDLLGYVDGMSLYQLVRGNPLNDQDPSGFKSKVGAFWLDLDPPTAASAPWTFWPISTPGRTVRNHKPNWVKVEEAVWFRCDNEVTITLKQHIFLSPNLVRKGSIWYGHITPGEVYAHEQRHVRNGIEIVKNVAQPFTSEMELLNSRNGALFIDIHALKSKIEDEIERQLAADARHEYPSAATPIPAQDTANNKYRVIGPIPPASGLPIWVDFADLY